MAFTFLLSSTITFFTCNTLLHLRVGQNRAEFNCTKSVLSIACYNTTHTLNQSDCVWKIPRDFNNFELNKKLAHYSTLTDVYGAIVRIGHQGDKRTIASALILLLNGSPHICEHTDNTENIIS